MDLQTRINEALTEFNNVKKKLNRLGYTATLIMATVEAAAPVRRKATAKKAPAKKAPAKKVAKKAPAKKAPAKKVTKKATSRKPANKVPLDLTT